MNCTLLAEACHPYARQRHQRISTYLARSTPGMLVKPTMVELHFPWVSRVSIAPFQGCTIGATGSTDSFLDMPSCATDTNTGVWLVEPSDQLACHPWYSRHVGKGLIALMSLCSSKCTLSPSIQCVNRKTSTPWGRRASSANKM